MDERFIVMNEILSRKSKFTIDDLYNTLTSFCVSKESIKNYINELMDCNLIFEDGIGYIINNKHKF